jgi:hypothetical protein
MVYLGQYYHLIATLRRDRIRIHLIMANGGGNNTANVRAVKGKMETQIRALTRLAASTWGCDLIRAREVHVKVIRVAMAYGAGVTHDPNRPKVVRGLQACQNKGLRRVLEAYKATPIRNLELEAFALP